MARRDDAEGDVHPVDDEDLSRHHNDAQQDVHGNRAGDTPALERHAIGDPHHEERPARAHGSQVAICERMIPPSESPGLRRDGTTIIPNVATIAGTIQPTIRMMRPGEWCPPQRQRARRPVTGDCGHSPRRARSSETRWVRLTRSLVPSCRIITWSPPNHGCSSRMASSATMRRRWMRVKRRGSRRASSA